MSWLVGGFSRLQLLLICTAKSLSNKTYHLRSLATTLCSSIHKQALSQSCSQQAALVEWQHHFQPQALHESAAEAKKRSDAISASSATPPKPLPLPAADDTPSPAASELVPASQPLQKEDSQEEMQVLSPVDYDGLVNRAMSQEEEGLSELRKKAGDAGVVR